MLQTEVRMFEEIMRPAARQPFAGGEMGLSPVRMVVIETDGDIQQSDILKTAYHGAPQTGLHVLRDPLDGRCCTRRSSPGRSAAGAAPACRGCGIVSTCGGGLYAHRYSRTPASRLPPSTVLTCTG